VSRYRGEFPTQLIVNASKEKLSTMEATTSEKWGLYLSYNEEKNGPFEEAVRISKELGCVTWFEPSALDPKQLQYPTDIIVRLSGQDRYFRGTLLAIALPDALSDDFETGERNHRPAAWYGKDVQGIRCVLFINGLESVSRPPEVEGRGPPQRPAYIRLSGSSNK
jgi:hypothetical protein